MFLYTLALAVITSAVMLSVARILLPELKGYREHIQQELGKYLEHDVRIASMDARLIGLTPTLIFSDVRLLDETSGKEIIFFKEARLGIAVIASLAQQNIVPSDFTIVDTVIAITRAADGRFEVQGVGVDVTALDTEGAQDSKGNAELAEWLFKRSNINLHDSTIIWKQKGKNNTLWRFEHVNISLHSTDDRHQLSGEIKLPADLGNSLEVALDVYGDLLNPAQWKGVFYFNGKGVQFDKLGILPTIKNIKLKSGISDYEIWGKWENGMLRELMGDVALYGIALQKSNQRELHKVDVIQGLFSWQGDGNNWSLNTSNIDYIINGNKRQTTEIAVRWMHDETTRTSLVDMNLEYCRVEDVREVVLFGDFLDKKLGQTIHKLKPAGDVRSLRIFAEQKDKQLTHYQVSAVADKVNVAPWKNFPGVRGVSGKISFSEEGGAFDVQSSYFVLAAPELFRNELYINQLTGTVRWEKMFDQWQVSTRDMIVENNDLHAVTDLTVTTSDAKSPVHMDIQVALSDMNATAISRYLPAGILSESLLNWLDQAFKGGAINKAGFVYHGKTRRLPFRRGTGILQTYIEADDMTLSLQPDWPELHSAKFNAVISDRSIKIESATGKIYDSDIRNLDANIKNLSRAELHVSGKVLGSMADSARFMTNSPIAPGAKPFVSKTRFEGELETEIKFRIPLSKHIAKKRPLRYSGKTIIQNNHVYMNKDTIDVTNMNGVVKFSDKVLRSGKITATIMGNKGKLKLRSSKPEGKFVISIDGEGNNSGAGLYNRFALPGMQRVNGYIPWKSTITLAHRRNGVDLPTRMRVKSNLAGVEIDLPEPFRKSAETNRPFTFDLLFTGATKTETITQYGDRVSVHLEMDNAYEPARIQRGELHLAAGKAKLPAKNEFHVTGVLNDLSHTIWREVVEEHAAKHKKNNNEPILYIPVVIDMGYMSVPFPKNEVSSSNSKKRPIDPRILPVMKGTIKTILVNGVDMGKLQFSSRKQSDGLFFDKFKFSSPQVNFQGSTKWQYKRGRHRTIFKADLKTQNLGMMLREFGYKAIIEGGVGQSHFDLTWQGPPHTFEFSELDGTMSVFVEDGNIVKVDPGAGRLLGLLSLAALPRRLLLDFRDMSDGMSFDKLAGTFRIRHGDAVTENLKIESPLADVVIVGRTGLHKKDFDQIVTVTPQASGTLPVVGGLLGGTQVGAIVLLFERLFGSDMDKSLSSQYRITGTWKEPSIERIDKEKSDEDEVTHNEGIDEAA